MGDDSYHGGAFMLSANFDFYASFVPQKNPTVGNKERSRFEYGEANAYDFFLKRLTMENILASMSAEQRELLEKLAVAMDEDPRPQITAAVQARGSR
jgi:hypothetical protein